MKLTCKQPDRHIPKLLCGHPLPCPWHTAQIDLSKNPPEIRIPITARLAWSNRDKLSEIAEVLSDNKALKPI